MNCAVRFLMEGMEDRCLIKSYWESKDHSCIDYPENLNKSGLFLIRFLKEQ